MSSNLNSAVLIIAMSLMTILLRFLPFLIFNKDKEIPDIVIFLGDFLPSAAIGMLVIYGLRDVNISVYPYGFNEIIASLAVVVLQTFKKNSILSIIFGNNLYVTIEYYLKLQGRQIKCMIINYYLKLSNSPLTNMKV